MFVLCRSSCGLSLSRRTSPRPLTRDAVLTDPNKGTGKGWIILNNGWSMLGDGRSRRSRRPTVSVGRVLITGLEIEEESRNRGIQDR